MAKFSENLAKLMADRGLSQSTLAAKAGITQPRISGYLTESKYSKFPSLKILIALARALRCSIDELVGLEPFKRGDIKLPDDITEAMKEYDKLPKEDRKLIRLLVERLSKKATESE